MSNKQKKIQEALAKSKANLKLKETPGSKPAPPAEPEGAAMPPVGDETPANVVQLVPKDKGKKGDGGKNNMPPLPRAKRAPKKKTPKECECGCGGMTKGGRFIPGHDSILNAWCLRVERGVIKISEIEHEGIREAVRRQMKAGGAKAFRKAKDEDGE